MQLVGFWMIFSSFEHIFFQEEKKGGIKYFGGILFFDVVDGQFSLFVWTN